MYTEFNFSVELTEDVSLDVVDILKFMLGEVETEPTLPEHPLFSTDKWRIMLRKDCYSFIVDRHSTLYFDDMTQSYFLCVRCNLENCDNEIEKFVSWIMPYLDERPGDLLGFSWYEGTEQPTLLFMAADNQPLAVANDCS
jgi:hypothetical protein